MAAHSMVIRISTIANTSIFLLQHLGPWAGRGFVLACFKRKISTRVLKKYRHQAHSWYSWSQNALPHVSREVWSIVESY